MCVNISTISSPYPYAGGKSRVAAECWQKFGDVGNYIEPFFGSGAMLLARPKFHGNETVNDADCYIANLWRAIRIAPDTVAEYADQPVNECDLHANHTWLLGCAEFRERMVTEPDYFDPVIAGKWLCYIAQWIGGGWCSNNYYWDNRTENMPIHASSPSRQLPHLGNNGQGAHAAKRQSNLYPLMQQFQERFRHVRVCCGDWSRVMGPSVTTGHGMTAIFFDPPYSAEAGRNNDLYAVESATVAHDVREWCAANGSNPLLRIALCGYDTEHGELDSLGWTRHAWKTTGGYGGQGDGATAGKTNKHREVIWFSPACIAEHQQRLGIGAM